MACKYVKEFDFGPQKTHVRGYARGGAASCNMAKGGAANKVARTMGEFKSGELRSGSETGPLVKSRDQAVAIALSQARAKRK